ncbi:hypothetical protein Q7P35_004610 [Cladosporium inversicolor]
MSDAIDLKTALERDGFVVVSSGLTEEELTELRTASQHITSLAREGKWPHIRTLPRQFPPWPSDPSLGIWGVQQLMNPSLPGHELFTKTYFSKSTLSTVAQLLGPDCKEQDLVMELYNLLIRPDSDFELRWHRDDIPPSASDEEELARLDKPAFHAQWNMALYEDSSLILVPGTHRRARTQVEREAGPYDELPGEIEVHLAPGEMAFYNNNILHRGAYKSDVERMTLHGSMGHVQGGAMRARNVLQHGREWIGKVNLGGLKGRERQVAEGMRDRLLALGSSYEETGFSQDD